MLLFAPQPALSAADAYRRQARRLRGRWANDPARMHKLLGELARRADSVGREAVLDLPEETLRNPTAARVFAISVRKALESGVLRYSQRQTLLREAQGMMIGRFEANLIIAAVQHQLGLKEDEASLQEGRRSLHAVWIALLIELGLLAAAVVWIMV